MKKLNLLITFISLSGLAFGNEVAADSTQVAAKTTAATTAVNLSTTEILIIVLFVFTVLLLIVSYILYKGLKAIFKESVQTKKTTETSKEKLTLWEKLLSLRPISSEKSLEIPHEYDGIKELNNPTPSWFNWLFYGSIVFGIGYLYYYHIAEWGPRQDDEYKIELAQADAAKRAYLAKSGGLIDERTVKIDDSQIEKGKIIFGGNCAACHGVAGEGLVGPNLTDDYFLHGGSINDIFKVIKYGVPEKGMVSWEKSLSAADISAVSNYIVSLHGSNPANAKPPQGEKYVSEGGEGAK